MSAYQYSQYQRDTRHTGKVFAAALSLQTLIAPDTSLSIAF